MVLCKGTWRYTARASAPPFCMARASLCDWAVSWRPGGAFGEHGLTIAWQGQRLVSTGAGLRGRGGIWCYTARGLVNRK